MAFFPELKAKYPTCGICLNSFHIYERVAKFTCSGRHIFHEGCAKQAAHWSSDCPYDREEDVNPFRLNVQSFGEREIRQNPILNKAQFVIISLICIGMVNLRNIEEMITETLT